MLTKDPFPRETVSPHIIKLIKARHHVTQGNASSSSGGLLQTFLTPFSCKHCSGSEQTSIKAAHEFMQALSCLPTSSCLGPFH